MRKLSILLTLVLAAMLAAACGAQTTPAPAGGGAAGSPIAVEQPWARPAVVGGTGAAYMVLKNSGKEELKLVGASSDVAQSVEIHQTTMVGGAMQMAPVKDVPVLPGGQTEFKPGGFHVMMIGLKRELKAGEKISIVLTFDKIPALTITADVKQQ